jgi:hypothetical protein
MTVHRYLVMFLLRVSDKVWDPWPYLLISAKQQAGHEGNQISWKNKNNKPMFRTMQDNLCVLVVLHEIKKC